MSTRNLQYLFRPKSVAVVGASDRPDTVGQIVTRNLIEGGFKGPVMPVNPKHSAVAGVPAFSSIAALPEPPDLAVICTPAATIPGIIGELGARSTKAAIVIASGLDRAKDERGVTFQQAMLDAAKPHLLRVLGPDSIGLMNARLRLNASFAHTMPMQGKLAFISQSGALATAVLDHAKSVGIGLAHCVSVGNGADVDFADVLDYLGSDRDTRAVLLYIESVTDARKFMSAARAASRNKLVLAIKGGRAQAGARAAALHSGGCAGSDAVIDAAIRRAGMLRVDSILELFDAVETLGRMRPLKGERLGILTNGGGPGVMAVDALETQQGTLSQLSDETRARLNRILPPYWSGANPVDILGDAPAKRHADAIGTLLDDENTDAVLLLHAPHAVVSSSEVAEEAAKVVGATKKNVLACLLGLDSVEPARRLFSDAGIPTYETPEHAVNAFLQMVEYRRNQQMLMETPDAVPEQANLASETVRGIVVRALAEKRERLSHAEANEILAAYEIPVVPTRVVRSPYEAAEAAEELGFPVALKLHSDDIHPKPDIGGVVLDIETAGEVRAAAIAMTQRLEALLPEANADGF
ncbi:MAG: acetate--CoA ligase family protein, partial [Thiohalocapsa sp.]